MEQPRYFTDLVLTTYSNIRHDAPFLSQKLPNEMPEPFFIGASHRMDTCSGCARPENLKVFTPGGLVIAGCFHLNGLTEGSGIHFEEYSPGETGLESTKTGWRAVVEPLEQVVPLGYMSDHGRRSPAVRVLDIKAFCMYDPHDSYRRRCQKPLLEGGIMQDAYYLKRNLSPIEGCHGRFIEYRFRIVEGVPTFDPL